MCSFSSGQGCAIANINDNFICKLNSPLCLHSHLRIWPDAQQAVASYSRGMCSTISYDPLHKNEI